MAVIWCCDLDPIFDDPNELRHNQEEVAPCVLCGCLLDEDDAVETRVGLAHEECAEKRWPLDPGDTRYPR